MPSEHNFWYGSASLSPPDPVVAGSYGTWRLTYTAGQYGIDNGGALVVCWRFAADWGRPQTTDPQGENYLTLQTTAAAKLQAAYTFKGHVRPWYHAVRVDVFDGEIAPGEQIVLTFGDVSGGSPGQRAQTAVEHRCEWRVFVDCLSTRRFIALENCPTLEIVSGEVERLVVVLPSDGECGQPTWVLLRAEDRWGNPAAGYRGTVSLRMEGATGQLWQGLPSRYTFTAADAGVKRFEGVIPEAPGLYRLRVVDETCALTSVSNPNECRATPPTWRRFWGDLHGQSEEALGLGSAGDYFRFARDVAAVDFASNQGNDFDLSDEGWRRIQQAVQEYHEPQRFITFLGYEWSGNTSGGGDHNVIFLQEDETLRRSSRANVEGEADPSLDCYPLSELYRAFAGRGDVLIIPHVGGRYANLSLHDPALEPLLEIYSGWGLFEWFLHEALRRGMEVGFVATSDDHKGRPGAASPGAHIFGVYGGLTCVLAEELTREAIFRALKARRCYATSGARILLRVTCNGHQMGEAFVTDTPPTIEGRVVGTEGLESVEVRRFVPGDERPLVVYSHPLNAQAPLSNRLKIVWTGLRQIPRYFQTVWDGRLTLSQGRIVAAEGYAFDTPLEGITERTERSLAWCSQTTGDEDGVIIEVDAPPEARLRFEAAPCTFEVKLGEIGAKPKVFAAGGVGQQVLIKRLRDAPSPLEVAFSWTDEQAPAGRAVYYVKVVQVDGALAYSSPFYVTALN